MNWTEAKKTENYEQILHWTRIWKEIGNRIQKLAWRMSTDKIIRRILIGENLFKENLYIDFAYLFIFPIYLFIEKSLIRRIYNYWKS